MDFILSSSILETVIIFATVAYILYKLSVRNFDYWKKKGVPYVKPLPFIGNFLDVFLFRTTLGNFLAKLYNKFDTQYFGIYILNTPHLVLKDPNLIKLVLVKDFNYFNDRTILCDEKCDSVLSKMLFVMKHPEWRTLRVKMSPTFTSGKIKNMVTLINDAAKDMIDYLDKIANIDVIESKEVCAKYSTDVIASCAFGITANSFKYENAKFRDVGRQMFRFGFGNAFRQTSYFVAPSLVKLFRLSFFDTNINKFLKEVFWATIHERERSKIHRNDLIDMVIPMMKESATEDKLTFAGDVVVSQAAQFFAAGFETTSSTMGFALYELCLQPKIQNRLRLEIKSTLSEHGEFTYEAVQSMNYLNMILCETLRKYPVLPFLDRVCNTDYKVPGSDYIIEKGTRIYIPLFGLHYDPIYFPDPEKFDPERFSNKNKHNLPNFTYIPFGEGPRNCIGERFALLVTKMGLVNILQEFELEPTKETPVPLEYNTKSFLLASKVGLPMKFKKVISVAA